MPAKTEGHDLESDVGLFRHFDQMPQLRAHHFTVAVRTAQRRLVQHGMEMGCAFGDEGLLALQSQRHAAVDLDGGRGTHAPGDDRVRVGLGLQQAVDELDFVHPDE